ncbi:ATP-binding cassette sub-family A member 9-like isoform X2 [Mya arenaria]|nr:ATP-binding cassette sub-family A member 9-like isoform X2 [Mya arenaria]
MLILFLMLYMYGLSIITASFTITTFLNKTVIAGAVTNILTILIGILYFAVAFTQTPTATGLSYSIPFSARCLLCLLSPFSLAIAIDQTVFLDLGGSGLTFSTLTSGEFPVLVPLAFLILDTGLYFLLALVFDRILPKDNGTGQPPCFMFRSSSLHTSVRKALREIVDMARETEEDTGVDEEMVEPVSNEIRQKLGISINNMTTVFGKGKEKVMAVNGLSLDIYEDQVTAILGHNGAGKTTTLNILTGLSKATSGTAHILGLDVSQPSNMVKIRSMMGVCPQENILFDDLTCAEHLTLFAAIKGVKQIEQEVKLALERVKLTDQKDTLSSALSGGQKRKLCLTIALIGDSKLLFLDEPTAGVDTDSRRHIWSVLKGLKKGRIIVLNTHVMEEADILADRKAIITKGTLKCCGSSVFLKNRFGIGYHLNVVLRADTTHEDVHSYVSKFIPGLKIGKVHKKEVDFVLPLTQVSKFPALFAGLEEEMAMPVWKSLGVINYGISMTTLEEVFLQIGKEGENSKLKDLKNKHPVPYKDDEQLLSSSQLEVEDEDNYNETDFSKLHCGKLLSGKQLKWEQFKAVLWMRILNDKRNKGQLLLQVFIPMFLMISGLSLSMVLGKVPRGEHPNEFALKAFYYTTMKGFMPYEGRYGKTPGTLVPDTSESIGGFLSDLSSVRANFDDSTDLLDTKFAPHYLGINLTKLQMDDKRVSGLEFTLLYNDSAIHAIPVLINLMSNCLLKRLAHLSGISHHDYSVSISSMLWPSSLSPYSITSIIGLNTFALAFVFLQTRMGLDIVKDRQDKIRSQLRIAGLPWWLYWVSYATLDMIKFAVLVLLYTILVVAFQVPSLSHGGAILTLLLICLTYMPASVLFVYVTSFIFKKWVMAQVLHPLMIIMGAMMAFLVVVTADFGDLWSTASLLHVIFCIIVPPYTIYGGLLYIDKVHRNAELASDGISFGEYFTGEILAAILIPIFHVVLNLYLLRILDGPNSGGSYLGPLKSLFTRTRKRKHQYTLLDDDDDITVDIDIEDEDVRMERRRVQAFKFETQDYVKYKNNQNEEAANLIQGNAEVPACMVCGVRKEYPKPGARRCCCCWGKGKVHVAVDNSSFAVRRGEVFGLLGPNGAGKSTTLSLITDDVKPNRGQISICGLNNHSSQFTSLHPMGFCPQVDALWASLTLKEHLECYAQIRGLSREKRRVVINFLLKYLNLKEDADKLTPVLSGGTKRKLSYCMSILGNPCAVLLDEPSTGIDPHAKQLLWKMILGSVKSLDCGVLLTTHNMEEADALCSRIAIMVNGKLECLGSGQHLKNKFGSNYILDVKSKTAIEEKPNREVMDRIKAYVSKHFPGAEIREEFDDRAQFKIPRTSIASLARAFSLLEEAKTSDLVEEYSFTQPTLEQVFLEFTRNQQIDDLTKQ